MRGVNGPFPQETRPHGSTNLICGSLRPPLASASESCADKWARGGAPGPDFCPRCQRSWEQGRGGGGRWIRTNQTGSDKWVGFNLRPINILVLLSYPLVSSVCLFVLPPFLLSMSHAFSPTFPTRVECVSYYPASLGPIYHSPPRFTILENGCNEIACVRNTGILESTEPPPLRDTSSPWIYSHTLPVFTTTRTTRLELVVRALASLLMQLSD